ncbi:Retrovirus Polyprotein [Phytophthora cinnamomi]|uniref:Retrovirus Polyprotein n=1 Tax=Phytophthora cinnamomi TaxID=4785 RepID=UPI00355A98D9|nr:Retrovirus Polyprotein [Phytophthora cinnamomi]
MMTTNESARDERAQRRAASAERATAAAAEAAKRQHTTAVTLVTGDGGTVMLSTDEIRRASGDTPTATTIGQSGGGTSAGGDAAGSDSGQRTLRGSRGSDGDSHASGVQRGPGGGNAGTNVDTPRGTDTSAEATISTPLTGSRGDAAGTGGDGGPGGAGTGRGPATPVTTTMSGAEPARPIIVREKAKSLKLTKFKGLDDAGHDVAQDCAGRGEVQRWFATVMESVPESEENINTLADMLRAKYMTQRTGPEVVDLLNARRQMRGERLVEYAQSLREIGERGDVGEDWLVNAFLKGMSSSEGATHVRGHRPRTLDEAVNMAVPHVGEYGEGYGVGLDSAMARWDEREATNGRGPLTASASVTAPSSKEQSGLVGNFGSVVSGYGPMWGTTARPPRYDTSGRPVLSGKASATEWWRAIPPGFELVPAGTSAARGGGSKIQTTSGGERGKRPGGGDQNARQRAKALKVEGQHDATVYGTRDATQDEVFETREGRLQRYHERR